MNVTYEYYKESFGGSLIPENRWISLELKMSARLNQYTFDRMKEDNWPEQAKTALCEMCDCAYKYERREGKISENNDGYSVSYDTSKPLNVMLYEIAENFEAAAKSALDAAKSALGIHSPSRVFRDQVGKMMALGMGIGFEKNIPLKSMNVGVQRAVSGLQKSVDLALSARTADKTVGRVKNYPGFDGGKDIDYDRLEKIQMRAAEKMAKRPIYLGTKRIDEPLPKGAVPAL